MDARRALRLHYAHLIKSIVYNEWAVWRRAATGSGRGWQWGQGLFKGVGLAIAADNVRVLKEFLDNAGATVDESAAGSYYLPLMTVAAKNGAMKYCELLVRSPAPALREYIPALHAFTGCRQWGPLGRWRWEADEGAGRGY